MSSSNYTVLAMLERTTDTARSEWPLELIERFNAIAGVVDSLFPDLSAAWSPASAGGAARETHRRVIEVLVKAPSPAAAAIAVQRIRALVLEVAAGGLVTLAVTPAESIEVLG